MAADLNALRDEVANVSGTVDSAITLIEGLHAALDASKTDPAAIEAILNDLKAKRDALANAVAANPL